MELKGLNQLLVYAVDINLLGWEGKCYKE